MLKTLLAPLFFLFPLAGSASPFDCTGKLDSTEGFGLLSKVERRYDGISDIQASFAQDSLFVGLDKRESSTGTVSFMKPGRMDWHYKTPEEQRFIADGKTVWFFQPELNQVTIDSFRDSFQSELPVTFLLGIGKLSQSFKIKGFCRASDGFLLDLEPKNTDSTIQQFALLVRGNDYTPLAARVIDLSGNETAIALSELRLNSGLSSERFSFQIPKGADVIDQRTVQSTPSSGNIVGEETVIVDQSSVDAMKRRAESKIKSKQKTPPTVKK